MNTTTAAKKPSQQGHINLSEPAEIRHWAEQFGVSDQEIIDAVKQVGGSIDEVRRYLRRS